jgi:YidC/Oxa1 family membrane protein insertase
MVMANFILTQNSTPIIGWCASLLGKVMEWIYVFFSNVGIENIGLCIIVFTLIIKLILFPLAVKQQKFSKLSSLMNPELQAIQKKYQGKKDNESMMKMQEETTAVESEEETTVADSEEETTVEDETTAEEGGEVAPPTADYMAIAALAAIACGVVLTIGKKR